ncbi:N-acetylmuramoyl-L-alanine amidase [Pontibacillus sp. ALD_SL1]|uniref:N-acetylmuramoyl-L-alanine amidase n=1 Tax=Pontibacillus sp. ALD_SL1 TaxID=2777185 RepID=UPI001A96F22A|nr:N-acetylmuramoyl-L-alanine amidase [Pontibacillus sp. ALD_SL1]QSS98851.1 N-acetylmuramoyl-L-alanine amidase [Pontibacillus sp. ALD_SL1]
MNYKKIMTSTALGVTLLLNPVMNVSAQTGIVDVENTSTLNVRETPTDGTIIGSLKDNSEVQILEIKGDWAKIQFEDLIGWSSMNYIDENQDLGQVSFEETFNIYQTPDTSTKVGAAKPTSMDVLERRGDWYKVDTYLGITWVKKETTQPDSTAKVSFTEIFNIYKSPDKSTKIGAAKPVTMDVVEQRGNWYKVNTYLGPSWVYKGESTQEFETIRNGTVTADYLNVRTEPTLSGTLKDQITEGATVSILKTSGVWYYVSYGSSKGWVHSDYILNESTQGFVTADVLNIRSGPGEYVKDQVTYGTRVIITKYSGEWAYVSYGGNEGWAHTDYIKESSNGQLLEGKTIILDPGHGGYDNGALAIDGRTQEEDINLEYSKDLQQKLELMGATVILTRNSDVYVELDDRADLSAEHNADIFISIHANSIEDPSVSGSELFYNTTPCDTSEEWCDKGEQNDYPDKSEDLATSIWSEIKGVFGESPRGLDGTTHYRVNRMNTAPSVLIELGFLSNWSDLSAIKDEAHKEEFVKNTANGVVNYFRSY